MWEEGSMRKKIRILATGFLLCLSIVFFTQSLSAEASSLEESIKKKQQAISQAQNEKKQLQAGMSNIKKMVQQLEKSKKNLETYVVELDKQLAGIEEKIEELKAQITAKKEEIEQTKADLEKAEEVAARQYSDMKIRMKYMYENGKQDSYFSILATAGSFADMLNQASYIEQLSSYDKKKLLEYKENVEYVKLCKLTLEEEEEVLEEAEKALEQEEASVNTLISEKEKEINAYQKDITTKEQDMKAYEEEIAAQTEVIAALEKAVAAEKAQLAEQNRLKYDGGMFQMPCPGYTRMSSDFGWRIHPTLGYNKFHNGVDFAAPKGTPILAAYSGKVVASAYNSSMGNYIMIDHGSGLYTIYMHASKLYVSTGKTVSKGETIAAVGTTGRSTGNHLHFGVRLNGEYVSPWKYLK